MNKGRLITGSIIFLLAFTMFFQVSLANDIVDELTFPKLNKIEMPKVEKKTLDNGIRLYLIEDKSLPTFEASVRVNCGSYLEPADMVGLASICGTVMRTGGTKKWSGDKLDEILEGIGGTVETSIGRESGTAYVQVLSEHTDLALEVLSQVLRYPVFDEDKINLAKVQERTDISRRNDEPWPIATRLFRKNLYGEDSPYGRHTEYATINAITRDDLVDFHAKYYHPENIQIAIWGDLKKKDIIKKIEKYFSDWPAGNTTIPAPPQVDYKYVSKLIYAEKLDAPQTNIIMGHIGGYTLDEDYPDRIVMNSVLGGGFGSRLTNNVRTRLGLAYSAGGSYTANIKYPGLFYAYAFANAENTGKAIKEMIKQIKSMQTDLPTDTEMKLGKDGYLNSFVFNFDTKSEVVNRMMTYDFYGLDEDLLFRRKEAVENVTKQDVLEAAKSNLHPDEMYIIVVGNKADFDMPLEDLGLGPVTQVDITIPSGETSEAIEATPEALAKGGDILLAAINAHGGMDNFKKVKGQSHKGTYILSTPRGDFPLAVEQCQIFPDKSKTVVNMMGNEMLDIRNGDAGWKTNQMGELVEKTPEDITKDSNELMRDVVYVFSTAGNPEYKAVYNGNDKVDGKDIDYVALLDGSGEKICRLGFYADSHRLASNSYWGETVTGEGNIIETYDNYSDISGVNLPLITYRSMDGQQVMKIEISEFKINPNVDDNFFSKPE